MGMTVQGMQCDVEGCLRGLLGGCLKKKITNSIFFCIGVIDHFVLCTHAEQRGAHWEAEAAGRAL